MGNLISSWFDRTSPDMRQLVSEVHVMERQLRGGSGGIVGGLLGVKHRAALVKTINGDHYLIEKGVSKQDDLNYERRFRQGECRIVLLSGEIFYSDVTWTQVESLTEVSMGLTLQDLFDACGDKYSLLVDNCQHGVAKMFSRTRRKWYEKYLWLRTFLLICLMAVLGLWMIHPVLPATTLLTLLSVKSMRTIVQSHPAQWPIMFLCVFLLLILLPV